MRKIKLSDFLQYGKICLPQKISIDMGLVNTISCNLHCVQLSESLIAVPARAFLEKGWFAVDDNGTLISLTDSDIGQKIVIIDDLHLWFALKQVKYAPQDVFIQLLDAMPRTKKYGF